MYGLDVLQCIVHGGFGLYFVGFVVLGGVLSFFLPKDKARLGLALAALVMYGVCEFIATVICKAISRRSSRSTWGCSAWAWPAAWRCAAWEDDLRGGWPEGKKEGAYGKSKSLGC